MKNRKFIFILTIFCLLFAGCRNTPDISGNYPANQPADTGEANEPARYIPEFQILPYELDIHQTDFWGEDIYYVMHTGGVWDIDSFYSELYRGNVNHLQLEKIEIPLQEREIIQAICTIGSGDDGITNDGGMNGTNSNNGAMNDTAVIYLVTGNAETILSEDEEIYYHLLKLDQDGNIRETLDITAALGDENGAAVEGMEVDGEGNIYLFTRNGNQIIALNPQGESLFTYGIGTDTEYALITGLCAAHGRIYAASFYRMVLTVAELDLPGKKWETIYESKTGYRALIAEGQENQLLFNMGGQTHKYDLDTGAATPLLTWMDCNIDAAGVLNLKYLADGRLFAIDMDDRPEYIFLRPAMPGEDPDRDKETLTVQYVSHPTLRAVVNQFNKTRQDYRFEIVEASPFAEELLTQLHTDLMAGNCSDVVIFNLWNGYNTANGTKKATTVFPLENYVEMGRFVNLYDYMAADPDFHREDFLDSLLETFEEDGELYYLPLSFGLNTILASPSAVGGNTGWTLDEMMACVERNGGRLTVEGMGKGSAEAKALSICLRTGIGDLTRDGVFNRELMLKMLTFARQTAEAEVADPSAEEGLLLTVYGNGGDQWTIEQIYAELYHRNGEAPIFIGYPTESGNGTLITSSAVAAISSDCPDPEAAWELLRGILYSPREPISSQGYPIHMRKDYFEEYYLYWGDKFREEVLRLTPEAADEYYAKVSEMMEATDTARIQTQLELIITEEAEYYFQGAKPVEEIVDIIANRVTLYLEEGN